MEAYNPFANNDVENLSVGCGPMIVRVLATNDERKGAAERYLAAHGYIPGWYDRGDGTQVEGWKMIL